jgi:hypothetical protein
MTYREFLQHLHNRPQRDSVNAEQYLDKMEQYLDEMIALANQLPVRAKGQAALFLASNTPLSRWICWTVECRYLPSSDVCIAAG